MTDANDADSYGIVVPVEWVEIPLDREGFDRYRREVLDELKIVSGWNKTAERRVDLLFTQVRNDLLRGQARMAAVFAESHTSEEGELEVLIAACAVSRLAADQLSPTSGQLTVDMLHRVMSRGHDDDEFDRATDVEPPTRVELDSGAALRLKRMHTQMVAPAQQLQYYAQSYLVPHNEGRSLCVMQFSTPCLDEAGALDELFEAIAETLKIFRPDDPTDFESATSRTSA